MQGQTAWQRRPRPGPDTSSADASSEDASSVDDTGARPIDDASADSTASPDAPAGDDSAAPEAASMVEGGTEEGIDSSTVDGTSPTEASASMDSGADTGGDGDDAGYDAPANAGEASTTAPDTGADTCSAAIVSTAVANGTYAIGNNAGFYLDDPGGGGAGTGLDQWAYAGTNQQWTVTLVSGTQYKILAQNGLALTAGSGTGVQVTLTTYTGATTQLWTFTTNGSGYNIVNAGSCLALDDGGGGTSLPINVSATTFSTSTVTSHYWTLTTSSSITAPIADGTYEFLDSAGYSLDDESGGGAGTAVGQWVNTGPNQYWTVTLVSGVQYKIIGTSGAALTATTANGYLANLSTYTGASNQLWVFVPSGSSYNVINVGSYIALDDDNGGLGVQVNQWGWSATNANQRWTLGATPQASCTHTSVTTNTYSSRAGHITWQNTGSVAEVNPEIIFAIPNGATMNASGCALGSQTVPGSITAIGCAQGGQTVWYEFVGSLAAGASITAYYTTQNGSEAAATVSSISANSCQ